MQGFAISNLSNKNLKQKANKIILDLFKTGINVKYNIFGKFIYIHFLIFSYWINPRSILLLSPNKNVPSPDVWGSSSGWKSTMIPTNLLNENK